MYRQFMESYSFPCCLRTCLRFVVETSSKAKTGEKAECAYRYMSILSQFLTELIRRTSHRKQILSGVVAFLLLLLAPSMLWAETRSLKIYYIHTREKAEIAYKKDGRYIDAGLKKLNHMLRDWRRNEPTNMDPRLFDLVWQVYKLSGSRDYIHVVSAYRSPATNNMLRSRSASSGVAKNSQHTLGKALDFYLPDVNLAKLRGLGLRQEGGGVGYYPTSGSPFIHMDVGSVRHWPRMNRKELMALFPDGKTIHVPSDGKPLEGYNQALAAYNARKGAPPPIVVAREEKTKGKSEKKPLFAGLFGKKKEKGKKQTQDPAAEIVVATAPPVPEQRVVLPEDNVPIPAFSPLKGASEREEDEQEDVIGALLVAEATRDNTSTDNASAQIQASLPVAELPAAELPAMGLSDTAFVPIPVMKSHPSTPALTSPVLAQEEEPARQPIPLPPVQTAHIPALSRPIQTQNHGDALGQLIAKAEEGMPPLPETLSTRGEEKNRTNINERRDFVISRQEDPARDLVELDRDTIGTLIADAMAIAEADSQVVASITPRTTPKANKPRLDELGALIAQDEAQRSLEALDSMEKIRQIPELVFVSGLQKGKKQPAIAKLDGKAINFPPMARTVISD